MEVYRITKAAYSKDLTGIGSRLYGGRWNHKGAGGLIYTAESRALAKLEFMVHLPLFLLPSDLAMCSIEIPSGLSVDHVSVADLPSDWRACPAPSSLADIGSSWVRSNKSLLLRVPSAIVEHEYNVLINPNHAEIHQVRIRSIEEVLVDSRLLRERKE